MWLKGWHDKHFRGWPALELKEMTVVEEKNVVLNIGKFAKFENKQNEKTNRNDLMSEEKVFNKKNPGFLLGGSKNAV